MKTNIQSISCQPFNDQLPGTSGLRKKVTHFKQQHYLENFVQSVFAVTFDAKNPSLVIGGDGRYHNLEAIQVIIKMAIAHGYKKIYVAENGWLSTPAASHKIRHTGAHGGIILSASHNPGGPNEDFGIKYNASNGGPAPESMTDAMHQYSLNIQHYRIAECDDFLLTEATRYDVDDCIIEVFNGVDDYSDLMQSLFDYSAVRELMSADDFSLCFDAMGAITGPYAQDILISALGATEDELINCEPSETFNDGHPDPNLKHAKQLVAKMYDSDNPANFGAASDGDGDRNMIMGDYFFVTPSDSLAVIAANAQHIPAFKSGLKGVARSMPTSQAVDVVAKKLGIQCYETPTGWKFFGNLLDDNKISLCGEESFGTGADHIREKDGLWAVLCWLNILAEKKLSVEEIVRQHWAEYGRHYYSRHDYEAIDNASAEKLMAHLNQSLQTLDGAEVSAAENLYHIRIADNFSYHDPVDNTRTDRQGIRFIFSDGSRIIFRLSGTGTQGATLRVYLEKYEADVQLHDQDTQEALSDLIEMAEMIANIAGFTGRTEPTVIT